MLALIRDAQALPKPELPEFEPLRDVHAGRGIAANHTLLETYQKHARGLLPDVAPPLRVPAARLRRLHDLLRLLQEGLPGDQRPDGGAHGRRASMPRSSVPTRSCGAWRGARWSSASTPSSRRGARRRRCWPRSSTRGAAGQRWLGELATSRDPWFNINVGDGFYHYHRSWNDDLTHAVRGPARLHRHGPQRRVARAADRAAAGRSGGS